MTLEDPDEHHVRALLENLDLSEPQGVISVSDLTDAELVSRYTAVQQDLRKMGELLEARSSLGKEFHSQHGALLVEMKRRGLR